MRFLRFLTIFAVLIFAVSLTAFSQGTERIFDEAGILTGEEKSSMENRLEGLSERLGFEILICTSEEGFEDFTAENLDGIVLFHNTQSKEYYVETFGKGRDIFGEDEIQLIYAEIDEYFQKDKVYEGFNVYIRNAQKIWEQSSENADSEAASGYKDSSRKRAMFTAGSLIAGMFAAMGITNSMKKKMNTEESEGFFLRGNFEISLREEQYLYSEKEIL